MAASTSSSSRSGDFASKQAERISDSDDNSDSSLIIVLGDDRKGFFSILREDDPRYSDYLFFAPVMGGETVDLLGKIVSTFHGIVCMVHLKGTGNGDNGGEEFIDNDEDNGLDIISLWNPSTGENHLLPPPPPSDIYEDDSRCFKSYGFGFDVKTNSYKLIRFVVEDSYYCPDLPKSQTSVYCLSTDSWRVTEPAYVPHYFRTLSNPKRPWKDFYCWFGDDQVTGGFLILSFNFTDERFGTIPVPKLYGVAELTLLLEDIAIIDWIYRDEDTGDKDQFNIWVLNGATMSWTIKYTVIVDEIGKPFGPWIGKTFGCSMSGKLISRETSGRGTFYLYDPLTQKTSVVRTQRRRDKVAEVAVYKESSVSIASAITEKKMLEYQDLSKKIEDFNIFGYAKPVLPPRAADDALQEKILSLVQHQKRVINKLKKDKDSLQEELSLLHTRPPEEIVLLRTHVQDQERMIKENDAIINSLKDVRDQERMIKKNDAIINKLKEDVRDQERMIKKNDVRDQERMIKKNDAIINKLKEDVRDEERMIKKNDAIINKLKEDVRANKTKLSKLKSCCMETGGEVSHH